MTPGCSSNVRFTRSSNSRIRSICVYIQTRSGTGAPLQGELCARGLVASVEDLGDRQAAELLGEDLDAPWAVVALVAAGGDVLADRELALAGQLAVVDDLVDRVVHVVVLAVAQLDPADAPGRDAAQVVRLDPELRHVPGVDRDAGVRDLADHSERGLEVAYVDIERHEFVDDLRVVVLGGIGAELGEALGQPRELA